jgi:large subunit ribosomal protein L41
MFGIRSGLTRAPRPLTRSFLRGKMSPKRGNKNFYKGYGARRMGKHTSKGRYIIDKRRIPILMIPNLKDCDLKPYVSRTTPQIHVPPPKVPDINLEEAEIPLKFILSGLKPYQILRELKKMKEEAIKKGEVGLESLPQAAKELLAQAEADSSKKRRMSFNPYHKLPPRYWLPPEERKAWLESKRRKKKTDTAAAATQSSDNKSPSNESSPKLISASSSSESTPHIAGETETAATPVVSEGPQ